MFFFFISLRKSENWYKKLRNCGVFNKYGVKVNLLGKWNFWEFNDFLIGVWIVLGYISRLFMVGRGILMKFIKDLGEEFWGEY